MRRALAAGLRALVVGCAAPAAAQTPAADTAALPPITVAAARADLPLDRLPFAVSTVAPARASVARPHWGLDEVLDDIPGVFVANRFNFSLDQRIAIRGFGARSAFAVRGVRILIDGIPQTLPDGQGQLTNLDLGTVERIEVWRGAASALHGNAAGGVISIWTGADPPRGATWTTGLTAGSFDRRLDRTWTRSEFRGSMRLGRGSLRLSASRLRYAGERNYSAADLRSYGLRATLPVTSSWTLTGAVDWGDQPKAENPGALTAAELASDRNQAAPVNLARHAGKDVAQLQAGLTLRHTFAAGGELVVTAFGLTRDLENPQTFAWIAIDRHVWGARATVSRPLAPGPRAAHLTAGVDWQVQRDDRVNFGNTAGSRDTTRTLDQRERVRELGLFTQVTIPLTGALAITSGARYDRLRFAVDDRLITAVNPDDSGERTMRALSGSLGAAWQAHPRATFYVNAGTAFESPTTTELANRPSGAGGFNDSLGPQRAVMVEAGARWRAGPARGTIALFRAAVRDALIPYEVPAAPQRRFFRNAGRVLHTGVELEGAVPLGAGVALHGSYTWSRFRYAEYVLTTPTATLPLNGRAVPGVPVHRATLGARWASRDGPWVAAGLLVQSSVLVDDTLTTRVGGWARLDVRAGWDITAGGLRMRPFVAVQNVLDRHYTGSVVINAAAARYYEPAAGRNAYLGLTLGGGN